MQELADIAAAIELRMQKIATIQNFSLASIDPVLHHLKTLSKNWLGSSEELLILLHKEHPDLQRHTYLINKAAEAERLKAQWFNDDIPTLSEHFRNVMYSLLSTKATLESGYLCLGYDFADTLFSQQQHLHDLNTMYRQWLSDVSLFRQSLQNKQVLSGTVDAVEQVFNKLTQQLTGLHDRMNSH